MRRLYAVGAAWLKKARRITRKAANAHGPAYDDLRDAFIAAVVRDRTFADVGGLWGVVNEKVSVAHRHGAVRTAMIDIAPPEHELWQQFQRRMADLQLPPVEAHSADIIQLAAASDSPKFDVVHSSGILYHMPDPLRYLAALRKITLEHLILTSAITSTRIVTMTGFLNLPAAAVLFVPALAGSEKAIVSAYWKPIVGTGAIGITSEEREWRLNNFGPWWWLPTVAALEAMCRVAGFGVLDGGYTWHKNAYTLLLSAKH
jgi:hypothetical protein